MGMPRYLANKYKDDTDINGMLWRAFRAGETIGTEGVAKTTFDAFTVTSDHLMNCLLRHLYKADQGKNVWVVKTRRIIEDSCKRKVAVCFFSHHEIDGDGIYHPVYKYVTVSKFFEKKAQSISKVKERADLEAIKLRDAIQEIKETVIASRIFPAKLKQIIWQRDNYTCQICLRGREILLKNNLHLECDHIIPWVDGGKTSYENGRAICSECNKGRHHAKKYFKHMGELELVIYQHKSTA